MVIPWLGNLRDFNLISLTLRVVLAAVCGGLIGLERTYKRRPAGFRTHILICLGASVTMLTGQYLLLVMHYYTDIGRLGAQVVAGIGFIGAGTIMVTRHRRVKGLTTAAGLWTAAIVGLACGAGYYEGALVTTVLVLAAEMLLSRLEYRIQDDARELCLYVEYSGKTALENVLHYFRDRGLLVTDLELAPGDAEVGTRCAVFTLRTARRTDAARVTTGLSAVPGVVQAAEL